MKKVVKFLENILNVFLYISFAVIISVAGYYLGRIFIAVTGDDAAVYFMQTN